MINIIQFVTNFRFDKNGFFLCSIWFVDKFNYSATKIK